MNRRFILLMTIIMSCLLLSACTSTYKGYSSAVTSAYRDIKNGKYRAAMSETATERKSSFDADNMYDWAKFMKKWEDYTESIEDGEILPFVEYWDIRDDAAALAAVRDGSVYSDEIKTYFTHVVEVCDEAADTYFEEEYQKYKDNPPKVGMKIIYIPYTSYGEPDQIKQGSVAFPNDTNYCRYYWGSYYVLVRDGYIVGDGNIKYGSSSKPSSKSSSDNLSEGSSDSSDSTSKKSLSGSSSDSTSKKSSSEKSSEYSKDASDYDIEGYYEDNKSDYSDIDDAADGFDDDEDAWEDYE